MKSSLVAVDSHARKTHLAGKGTSQIQSVSHLENDIFLPSNAQKARVAKTLKLYNMGEVGAQRCATGEKKKWYKCAAYLVCPLAS